MSEETVLPSSNPSTPKSDKSNGSDENLASFSPPHVINSTLSLSWIAILSVGATVTLVSYFSGCHGVDLLIRASGAILIASLLLWSVSTIVIKGTGEIVKKVNEETKNNAEMTKNQTKHEIEA